MPAKPRQLHQLCSEGLETVIVRYTIGEDAERITEALQLSKNSVAL
jgi:hypothetical protein